MDAPDYKRTETALYESQRLMHDILQGSPIPAFVIGNDHKVIYWNKALEELSGIKTVDIVGTKEHWRAFYRKSRPCMADLLVDGAADLLPRLYSGKFTRSGLINDAYEATDFFPEMRARAGRWLRLTAAAIKGPQGRIVCAIETLEDITEFKSAEESFSPTTLLSY
jgi:PAS domain-containing protein